MKEHNLVYDHHGDSGYCSLCSASADFFDTECPGDLHLENQLAAAKREGAREILDQLDKWCLSWMEGADGPEFEALNILMAWCAEVRPKYAEPKKEKGES